MNTIKPHLSKLKIEMEERIMSEIQTSEDTKKYEIVPGDWIELVDSMHRVHRLHRIRSLIDFDDVKTGDYGGYIESEENLSHSGNCWVYSDAVRLDKNARVWGHAHVYGNAKLYNSAEVCDHAIVCDESKIYEDAKIHKRAKVSGRSYIHGITKVSGNADISGDGVNVYGNVLILDDVVLSGSMDISGVTIILGDTTVKGTDIVISGRVMMTGHTNIRNHAYIISNDDFISVTNIGEHRDVLTAYIMSDKQIAVNTCCFDGTFDDFIKYTKEAWKDTVVGQEYALFCKSIQERFEINRKTEGE